MELICDWVSTASNVVDCRVVALFRFSPFGAIKHHPQCQVVAEFLKTMLHTRGDEQHVATGETMPIRTVYKPAFPRHDHIDLIPSVGSLVVHTARRVESQRHGTMSQENVVLVVVGAGHAREPPGESGVETLGHMAFTLEYQKLELVP